MKLTLRLIVILNFFNIFSLVFIFSLLVLTVQAETIVEHRFEKSNKVSNQLCVSCHANERQIWLKSDHSKAMALADKENVLGNFDNIDVSHYGQKALFFIKENQYQVTISYDNKTETYPIKYTFGHYPLQQYLVETEQGKLQVLPFAWDSRKIEKGGQRWYHNYSHEEIRPEDRLHWRQPLQNWNGMCADCHSDGIVRNYNGEKNSFASQFDNINVGCLSCHGDMSAHAKTLQNTPHKRDVTSDVTSSNHPTGQWLRSLGEKTAHWEGDKRDNDFMDNCFACHSLRSPLRDGIQTNTPFLDQFTPQLPSFPNYYADGQIKEEVYVYGSFLQSKMFAAGVNCLDCHDKHTMKLKIEGNGLCLQCHGAEVYNVKDHHQHNNESTGAQCVNCHMTENRYMGVDDRRDHSFKIPRPDISSEFNTPNACTTCHDGKSNQWASNKLKTWHGKPDTLPLSKQFLMKLNIGKAISLEQHLSIINDENIDVISRATAIQLLSYSAQVLNAENLTPFLTHKEPLLRLSATNAANLLSPKDKVTLLSPLLKDKYKAIRVSAARNLVNSKISSVDQNAFDSAFKALVYSNKISSWRGEGRVNQASLSIEMNDFENGEQSLKKAIEIEPYFETGYINLADIYRSQRKPFQVASVLSKGIKKNAKSAAIHYSYGLHFVRQKNMNKAIDLFDKAMTLMPDNSQYAYTYVLALDGIGQSKHALNTLKNLISTYQNKAQLKELGLYLAQKLKLREEYYWFLKL